MKDGAWLVVSVLSGAGAFYGGMRISERPETKCVPGFEPGSARRIAEPRAAAAAEPTRETSPPRTPVGRLFLSCTPGKNVSILVDGKTVGDVCPLELDLAVGVHRVEARAAHHRPAVASVVIDADKSARVTLTLEDEAGLFYRSRIEFPELRAHAIDDLRDGKTAVLSGEMRNAGERPIREVQLAVDFLNEQGGVVAQKFVHPILEQTGAGVAPHESLKFVIKVPDIPLASWSRKIRWSVSLIGLTETRPNENRSGAGPR